MIPDLFEKLSGAWGGELRRVGVRLQPPLSILKASGSGDQHYKINFLVFSHAEYQPDLILKVTRHPRQNHRLRHEFEILRNISRIQGLSSTIPRPLGFYELGEHSILAETCLPGLPLRVMLRRRQRTRIRRLRTDAFRVLQWLLEFQASTASGKSSFPGRAAVEERRVALDRLGLAAGLPRSYTDRLFRLAEEFEGLSMPLTARHGDFWPGNILLNHDQVGVIDWENFSDEESPVHDALMFIVTLALSCSRTDWRRTSHREAFHRAFLEKTPLAKLAGDYLNHHLQASGLPKDTAHLLFCLFLMEITVTEHQDMKRQAHSIDWLELLTMYADEEQSSIFCE